ncbi:hypothetical protein EZS27_030150, partial [termite gut metagenome]
LIVRFKGDLLHGCCVLFPMLRYTVVAKVTNQKEAAHFLDSLIVFVGYFYSYVNPSDSFFNLTFIGFIGLNYGRLSACC